MTEAAATTTIAIRRGTTADTPAVLGLFDDAVAWLVARGQTAQWGTQPWSQRPSAVARADTWAASGGLRLALDPRGAALGALVVGAAPPYVPPPERPEHYVQALVTAPAARGRGVGAALLERAAEEARAAGVRRLRVDCWAGVPQLAAVYEARGFTRVGAFDVDGWPGAILVRDL